MITVKISFYRLSVKAISNKYPAIGGKCHSKMASHHANWKLPFDILGMIFAEYAKEETFQYPLETLLLVCLFWNHAAIGHRSLWTSFRIYLGHQPTSRVWTTRLPLRLARCGPTSPLDIDLRNLLDTQESEEMSEISDGSEVLHSDSCPVAGDRVFTGGECTCYSEARACVDNLLQVLAGQHGNTCPRWRTLTLDLGHHEGEHRRTGNQHLANALCHPTPMLTALSLRCVRLGTEYLSSGLFPNTALVRELSIVDCNLPSLPNPENVTRATIGWKEPQFSYQNLSTFRSATKVRKLALLTDYLSDIGLPPEMPDLRVLEIDGPDVPQDLMTSKTPQLVHLALRFDVQNLIEPVLQAKGVPLGKITRITLEWDTVSGDVPSEDEYLSVFHSAKQLMESVASLELLDTSGDMLSIIMKILWDSASADSPNKLVKTYESHKLILRNTVAKEAVRIGKLMEQGGKKTQLALEGLAKCWGLPPPDVSEDLFIAFLHAQVS